MRVVASGATLYDAYPVLMFEVQVVTDFSDTAPGKDVKLCRMSIVNKVTNPLGYVAFCRGHVESD